MTEDATAVCTIEAGDATFSSPETPALEVSERGRELLRELEAIFAANLPAVLAAHDGASGHRYTF
ncbi:MAG TPA: hypothetical protein VHB77_11940 [Planctomycetaceae bacterium]|nr:hypothetical protein [Planctomycetaceae bacterium]